MTIQTDTHVDTQSLQASAVSTTYDTMRKLSEGLRIWTTSEHLNI